MNAWLSCQELIEAEGVKKVYYNFYNTFGQPLEVPKNRVFEDEEPHIIVCRTVPTEIEAGEKGNPRHYYVPLERHADKFAEKVTVNGKEVVDVFWIFEFLDLI
ncbi:hypothetical protein GGI18_002693 [Coemansia linderi]|uniref:Uncharacterized protein n=1 Tax=Coemansia linderi TaxID=2663919 RepID=A0ACC1KEL9_9FUNG|nr:hypothetical protein GGI18_002693 [Coemansia linderi]